MKYFAVQNTWEERRNKSQLKMYVESKAIAVSSIYKSTLFNDSNNKKILALSESRFLPAEDQVENAVKMFTRNTYEFFKFGTIFGKGLNLFQA